MGRQALQVMGSVAAAVLVSGAVGVAYAHFGGPAVRAGTGPNEMLALTTSGLLESRSAADGHRVHVYNDGRRLPRRAFFRSADRAVWEWAGGSGECDTVAVNLTSPGTPVVRHVALRDVTNSATSADGRLLVSGRDCDNVPGLFVLAGSSGSADSATPQRLATTVAPAFSLSWSRDGSSVAYVEETPAGLSLMVTGVASGIPRTVISPEGCQYTAAAFSATDDRLLAGADCVGSSPHQLLQVDVSTSTADRLLELPRTALRLLTTPDDPALLITIPNAGSNEQRPGTQSVLVYRDNALRSVPGGAVLDAAW
jgi:hypothetical protein